MIDDEQKDAREFVAWARSWTWTPTKQHSTEAQPGVGVLRGAVLEDEARRTEMVMDLWRKLGAVNYRWQREMSALLASKRAIDVRRRTRSWHYVRDDHNSATRSLSAPEHDLEWNVIDAFAGGLHSLGARIIDVVNAVPLTKIKGGRAGNVEIDLVFLVEDEVGHSLQLIEAKKGSNNAWFAVVEALRQLALFEASSDSSVVRQLMVHRNPALGLRANELRAKSVVLAPRAFYTEPDQKKNSVEPARRLINHARAELGVYCALAVWDAPTKTIATLPPVT